MDKKEKDLKLCELEGLSPFERVMLNMIKMLQRTLFVVVFLWFISMIAITGGFLLYLNQYDFETVTTTVEQDGGDSGNANFIGRDGDITNGETKNNDNLQKEN